LEEGEEVLSAPCPSRNPVGCLKPDPPSGVVKEGPGRGPFQPTAFLQIAGYRTGNRVAIYGAIGGAVLVACLLGVGACELQVRRSLGEPWVVGNQGTPINPG